MVSYSAVLDSNKSLHRSNIPNVSVFVGGTSGLGQLTIEALVSLGLPIKIFIVGRPSSATRIKEFIQRLTILNKEVELVWLEAEVSILSEVSRVCHEIKEPVDLLFLSAGYAPLSGIRNETSEGFEITQALQYYSRTLFIDLLLPRLAAADSPRVISVLAGGKETKIDTNDLDLRKNFSATKSQGHVATMISLALDKYAVLYPKITFIHSWPGFVMTGNPRRGVVPGSFLDFVLRWVLEPVFSLFAFSFEEAAQRYLYLATNPSFENEKGESGVVLVNNKDCVTPNEKVMVELRKSAREEVWTHTRKVFEPYVWKDKEMHRDGPGESL